MVADIVLRGGTVVDGNGGLPFVGDVAIKEGKIVAVGPSLELTGAREVDCAGRHVCPGWTDLHTHYDAQCMWDPLMSPSGPAGVTTVIAGNCGVGVAPTRATREDRDFMLKCLGFVEDIPTDVIEAGAKWEQPNGSPWESFGEYMDTVDSCQLAVDIGVMVTHGAVRPFVLGPERSNLSDRRGGPVNDPVTLEEKHAIAQCVRESIAAGAIGFSASRFTGHRDETGNLMPGSLADVDEMVLIAKAVAEGGGGMIEMINDFSIYDDIPHAQLDNDLRNEHYDREKDWIKFIAKEYSLSVNWTQFPTAPGGGVKFPGRDEAEAGDAFLEQCAAEGLSIKKQMVVRCVNLSAVFIWNHFLILKTIICQDRLRTDVRRKR